MSISKKQFDLLEVLATETDTVTQRQLEEKTGYSLGKINNVMKELREQGLVKDGAITSAGLDTLETFRVKKAIFVPRAKLLNLVV